VRKDAHFRPIPRERGGAAGSLSYGARGPDLSLQIRAEGLVPGRKYRFDLGVDGVTYSLASRAAAPDGTWSLDTTLTAFAEGACVGRNFQPERPLAGTHALSFAIKNDGSPPTGTLADQAPPDGGGAQLPCAGNGDGNYGYVLYEAEPGRFEGTASR
jgi:hypothetical protein